VGINKHVPSVDYPLYVILLLPLYKSAGVKGRVPLQDVLNGKDPECCEMALKIKKSHQYFYLLLKITNYRNKNMIRGYFL
jgi:hypothetical protein